jgi:hypothetical protein
MRFLFSTERRAFAFSSAIPEWTDESLDGSGLRQERMNMPARGC